MNRPYRNFHEISQINSTNDLWDDLKNIFDASGGGYNGDTYYVATTGSDSNGGTSWDDALLTIDAAVNKCGAGDKILIAQGTYDEIANISGGVELDVSKIYVKGVGPGVVITNSDTTNSGKVLTITGNSVVVENVTVMKGETTSDNSILVEIDGASGVNLIDTPIIVQKVNHTGIQFTGGATYCNAKNGPMGFMYVLSPNGTDAGIGVDFDNCNMCAISSGAITNLTTGVSFAADGDVNYLLSDVFVSKCTTGVSLEAGASDNYLSCSVTDCTTRFSDNSGNSSNDRTASTTFLNVQMDHIEKIVGNVWYVDGTNGVDTKNGKTPETAFATITQALASVGVGDVVIIKPGTYDEAGLDLDTDGVQLLCETGTKITNTDPPDTCLTISGNYCVIKGRLELSMVGQKSLVLSGDNCYIDSILANDCSVGIENSGSKNVILNCDVISATTTCYDIQADKNVYRNCNAVGVAGRGFYLSTIFSKYNTLDNCYSIRNETSGFELVTGAKYNTIAHCTSGGEDGRRIDNGSYNVFADFSPEYHTPKFVGTVWYVDGTNGDDSNSGLTPDEAFATIGAAVTASSAGDAITIKSDTYTETGLTIANAGTELWCEIGTLIDPASGTALKITGDNVKIKRNLRVTPAAGQIGVDVDGNYGWYENVRVSGGANCWDIDGSANEFYNCRGGNPEAGGAGFDIGANSNRLKDCGTGGNTTSYGYHITGGADKVGLTGCTSVGHQTSGYYIDTGSSGCTILGCSSGANDGKWFDTDSVNVWSDFSYADQVFKEVVFTDATQNFDLFKVTGTVEVEFINGHVESALNAEMGNCKLLVYDNDANPDLTDTASLNNLPVGSFIGKTAAASVDLTVKSSATAAIYENTNFRRPRVSTIIVAKSGVTTYIRLNSSDGAGNKDGTIHWHCTWKPITEDGLVEAA